MLHITLNIGCFVNISRFICVPFNISITGPLKYSAGSVEGQSSFFPTCDRDVHTGTKYKNGGKQN